MAPWCAFSVALTFAGCGGSVGSPGDLASDEAGVGDTDGGDSDSGDSGDPDGSDDDTFLIDPLSLRAAVSPELPYVGAAVDMDALVADAPYAALLAREVSQVTPESAMKWGVLHPEPDVWDYAQADALVAFAEENRQSVRGHTLVWHIELPSYVSALTAVDMDAALRAHISSLVGRYAGRIAIWDVVNEAMSDTGELRGIKASSPHPFYEKLGAAYIATAFNAARAADPTAKLAYNDYGIEGMNPKSDAVYALLASLKAQNVPIDVVGMEFHITAYQTASFALTEAQIRQNIQRFAALGLEVQITELDVRLADLVGDATTRLGYQAEIYRAITAICASEPGCTGLTTWGITDKYSWIDEQYGADDPLLFDDLLAKKPAFEGVREAMTGSNAVIDIDLGLDTVCRTANAAMCEPFEGTALPSPWYRVPETDAAIGLTTTDDYRGQQSLRARVTAIGEQSFAGRNVFHQLTTGSIYLRARIKLVSDDFGSVGLMNAGHGDSPYESFTLALVRKSASSYRLRFDIPSVYPESAIDFTPGVWHCVLFRIDIGDTAGTAAVSVDGVSHLVATDVDTAVSGGYDNINTGMTYVGDSGSGEAVVLYDEVTASTSAMSCD